MAPRKRKMTKNATVGQIVSLIEKVRQLEAENAELRDQLASIGNALGVKTNGRALRGLAGTAPVKQKRRPITDPEVLERRRQALAKARAARAEKLAAGKPEAVKPAPRQRRPRAQVQEAATPVPESEPVAVREDF